jgi:hypothetical protein
MCHNSLSVACTALSVDCESVIYDVAPILIPLSCIQFWQLISIRITHCEGLFFAVSLKDPLHRCPSVQLAQFIAPQRHVSGLFWPKTVMLEGWRDAFVGSETVEPPCCQQLFLNTKTFRACTLKARRPEKTQFTRE